MNVFLVMCGKVLLKKKRRDWMDINEVVKICKTHGILFEGKCPAAGELEERLKEFFLLGGEFHDGGLAVEGYDRRVGWDRIFMIQAYPYHSQKHSCSVHVTEPDAVVGSD